MAMDDKTVSLKEVFAEIDAMPPVKAEGHDFIEKTCLKTRLELLPPAQPNCTNFVPVADCISRQAAKDYIDSQKGRPFIGCTMGEAMKIMLDEVPPAQSNLSEAYSKAVFTWLMDYQIRAAELKGRYTPYEVMSWVINDWRKEHERSD